MMISHIVDNEIVRKWIVKFPGLRHASEVIKNHRTWLELGRATAITTMLYLAIEIEGINLVF
jgi:hypothetical protein